MESIPVTESVTISRDGQACQFHLQLGLYLLLLSNDPSTGEIYDEVLEQYIKQYIDGVFGPESGIFR